MSDLNAPNNVWRNEVREILALAAYKARDFAEADRLMNEILSDQDSPPNLRQRAQLMTSLLAPRLRLTANVLMWRGLSLVTWFRFRQIVRPGPSAG